MTWDRVGQGEVIGGAVSYAALAARKLGWEAAVLTSAGHDFEPARDLPGVEVFTARSRATTRFVNSYDDDGRREQTVTSRADDVDLSLLPDAWRAPDVLLLAPVAGEVGPGTAASFEAGIVGATGQGWLRELSPSGRVSPRAWPRPAADLSGVHVLFLSRHDLPPPQAHADFLEWVPMVVVTRGWKGLTLLVRGASYEVPTLPRREVDPTGAGDVCAAAFVLRYHETGDPLEAAAFAACAASCAVEGVGVGSLGDRAEVERRLVLRERLLEDGDFDE